MDQGAEGQAVVPACREVRDIHVLEEIKLDNTIFVFIITVFNMKKRL